MREQERERAKRKVSYDVQIESKKDLEYQFKDNTDRNLLCRVFGIHNVFYCQHFILIG